MPKQPKVFKMGVIARFRVQVQSIAQQNRLGEVLAQAISQGRGFELRQGDNLSILVLVTPADDLGRVTKIYKDGSYKEVGVTQKPLGG